MYLCMYLYLWLYLSSEREAWRRPSLSTPLKYRKRGGADQVNVWLQDDDDDDHHNDHDDDDDGYGDGGGAAAGGDGADGDDDADVDALKANVTLG